MLRPSYELMALRILKSLLRKGKLSPDRAYRCAAKFLFIWGAGEGATQS